MEQQEQTAVEWLVEQMISQMGIRIENTTIGEELFEQAKEMEKQQILKSFRNGIILEDIKLAEDYYQETYGKDN